MIHDPQNEPQSEPGGVDYFADLPDAATLAPAATLERITELATEAIGLAEWIAKNTVILEEHKAKYDRINRVLLPGVMQELGMASFKMEDGSEVLIDNVVQASISADNKPSAFNWLREHDFDGLIKTKVHAEFGKGEAKEAEAATKLLNENGFSASMDEAVHPATLKSFVKEQLEAGTEGFPKDIFGVFEFKQAKIKAPKKVKAK